MMWSIYWEVGSRLFDVSACGKGSSHHVAHIKKEFQAAERERVDVKKKGGHLVTVMEESLQDLAFVGKDKNHFTVNNSWALVVYSYMNVHNNLFKINE